MRLTRGGGRFLGGLTYSLFVRVPVLEEALSQLNEWSHISASLILYRKLARLCMSWLVVDMFF
jgi:hypothetical protein